MPARSVMVHIHNNTAFTLNRSYEHLDHGEYTDDKSPTRCIASYTSGYFEGGSCGIMTGTQGTVRYVIDDGANTELTFTWDNAYSSNAVGGHYNLFTENVGDRYAMWHTGDDTQHNEELQLYIEESKEVAVPGFLPSISGFKFPNKWNDFGYPLPILSDIPVLGDIKFGDASNGLCGGMIYAVRDYYEAGCAIPQTTEVPNNANDPLTQYIINRLMASFDVNDVTMYLKLMNPLYSDTDENPLNLFGQQGRAYVTLREEWPMIKADIDSGHLSPIGLVRIKSASPADLSENHQVLVFGYRMHGVNVTLRIYDPNFPERDDIAIELRLESIHEPVIANHTADNKRVIALFRTNYERRDGFPRFIPMPSKNSFAISRTPEQIDTFWIGTDDKVHIAWNCFGQPWGSASIIGNYPPPAHGTSCSAIKRNAACIDVFWVGSDGRIYCAYNKFGDTWENHVYPIPGAVVKAGTHITAISRFEGHIDLFFTGTDDRVYVAWNDFGKPWDGNIAPIVGKYLPPVEGTGITAISRAADCIDIFWAGSDGIIYCAYHRLGEPWDHHVYQLPNAFPRLAPHSGISAINRTQTQVDIFFIGQNGKVYVAWNQFGKPWDNNVGEVVGAYPPPAEGAMLSCISRAPDQIDICWAGSNGKLYLACEKFGDPWVDKCWIITGDYAAPADGDLLTAINRNAMCVDIIWAGTDGKMYDAYNTFGENWDNHVYQIPGSFTVRI